MRLWKSATKVNRGITLPEAELCDGRLENFVQENSITVWNEHHNYFEAKITEQAVEFPDKTK